MTGNGADGSGFLDAADLLSGVESATDEGWNMTTRNDDRRCSKLGIGLAFCTCRSIIGL